MLFHSRHLLSVVVVLVSCCSCTLAESSDTTNPLDMLHSRYQELSPRGKAMAGATVGFVGGRIALKTATSVMKYGCAAFLTAEVLRMTGVMNEIPTLSQEQSNTLQKVKGRILQTTEDFRVQVHERLLNRKNIEAFFEQERMAAFGVAGGAIAAAVL